MQCAFSPSREHEYAVRLKGPGSPRTPQIPTGPQDAQKEKPNLA